MSVIRTVKKNALHYALHIIVLVVMCSLLYYGVALLQFPSFSDVAKYQCYAVGFWHGQQGIYALPVYQCAFLRWFDPHTLFLSHDKIVYELQHHHAPTFVVNYFANQSAYRRFSEFPLEYPPLSIVLFLPALLANVSWYQQAFAVWMLVFAAITYLVLLRWRSQKAALVCALYLVAGCWGTLAARIDCVLGLCTLVAVICAERKRWNWAFVALAVGTLLKFYPCMLLIPFLLAQQRMLPGKWFAWRRWVSLGLFVAVCVLVMGVSILMDAERALSPFNYFQARSIQVESVAASAVWIWNTLAHNTQAVIYQSSFGSLNINASTPHTGSVSLVDTVLLAAGILYVLWLQWRSKITLATSCLLLLLVVIVTGKVFSPQYLMWVLPLVAYVGGGSLSWVGTWTIIGLLTTGIYPYVYMLTAFEQVPYEPLFYPLVISRNVLLLGFTLCLLVYCTLQRPVRQPAPTQEPQDQPVIEPTPAVGV